MGLKSIALLGFDGGNAIKLSDITIHFKINDMQIAEDFQMIVFHLLVGYLEQTK